MKVRRGYVFFDGKYRKWRGRITFTNPETKKKSERWVTGETKAEAWAKLDEIRSQLDVTGVLPVVRQVKTFSDLAALFERDQIIPAVFVGGKKVAGYKNPTSPKIFLKILVEFFGKKNLNGILPRDVAEFKLTRLQTPTMYDRHRNDGQSSRAISSVNREMEYLRSVLNYGQDNGHLTKEQNPFSKAATRRLIERSQETRRDRFPTFGEELAILSQCDGERAHLRDVLILGADTGMRRGEIVLLSWKMGDINFDDRTIHLRPEITKTGRGRVVPMTGRVYDLLHYRYEFANDRSLMPSFPGLKKFEPDYDLVFLGLKEFKRSFNTACRRAGVVDLTFHDYSRHSFVSRSILAGIPPAVVLKASGHSSDEWKRYLNVTPDNLRGLLEPHQAQSSGDVRCYADQVLKDLSEALGFSWVNGSARLIF